MWSLILETSEFVLLFELHSGLKYRVKQSLPTLFTATYNTINGSYNRSEVKSHCSRAGNLNYVKWVRSNWMQSKSMIVDTVYLLFAVCVVFIVM